MNISCRGKSSVLTLAVHIALWLLPGTAVYAQTRVCDGKNIFPCSVGGTLLVLSKPAGLTLNGGSGTSRRGTNHARIPKLLEFPLMLP